MQAAGWLENPMKKMPCYQVSSVCLSAMFVHCIQMVEDIIKGNPISLGTKYTGVRKICDHNQSIEWYHFQ